MLGMKEVIGLTLTLLVLSSANHEFDDSYERSWAEVLPLAARLQHLMESRRSLPPSFDFLLHHYKHDFESSGKRKKSICSIGAGLSASCDHRDAVEAGQHHKFLESSLSPGRRRRRALRTFDKTFNFNK